MSGLGCRAVHDPRQQPIPFATSSAIGLAGQKLALPVCVLRSRRRIFARFGLAAITTSRVHAQAVPKAAEGGGDHPLSALARHFGMPVGVVLAVGLVWGWLRACWFKTPGGQSEADPADPSPKAPGGPAFHNLPPAPEGFVARAEPLRQLVAELVPTGSQVVIPTGGHDGGVGPRHRPGARATPAPLQNRAGESGRQRIAQEPEASLQFVADVEGLPLALVLLAAHLQRVPVLRVSQLREDLTRPELGAEAFQQAHADLLAEKGLVASRLTSWRPRSPEARLLAQWLSLSLSAPIPWELIQRCEPAHSSNAPGQFWYTALADLLGANRLDRLAGDGERYALHPLVRQFFVIQRQGWPREAPWRQRLAAAAEALAQQREGEDASGAVEFWRQACLADPNQGSAAFSLGTGLIRLEDLSGALGAFAQSRQQAEAAQDQRGIWIAWNGIGDVLVAQGDGPGALAAYRAGLAIDEGLANHDPANTQWQVDVAISSGKLGSLSAVLPISIRTEYLVRGREILLALKRAERLHANHEATRWFDQAIQNSWRGKI